MRHRLRGRWLRVDGRRLYVRTGGSPHAPGPPVLLVPGLASSGRYLEPTAVKLAAHRLVLAPDLPGAGRSPHASKPLTVSEQADLLHTLVGGLGRPPIVLGNSYGCQLAVELAVRYPADVHRLVLTSPVVAPKTRGMVPLAARFLAAMRHEPRRYLGILSRDVLRAWTRKGWANLRAMLDYPLEERARLVAAPTLVVRGARDPLVSERFARRLAARPPMGRYVELPSTHPLPYDAARSLAELVLGPMYPGEVTTP